MRASIVVLSLLGLACFVAANSIDSEFASFMVKYNKEYTLEELPQRIANYKQSKEIIAALNAKPGNKAIYGITKFSDMTPEEFKSTHKGYKASPNKKVDTAPASLTITDIPTSYDWRTKNVVTPVKDQGQCGSCWAFSATEGVESAWALAGHTLTELSPQQIVSCDNDDDGCDGGDLPTAFGYVKKAGLETEKAYPYTSGGGDTGNCKYDANKVLAKIDGFQYATKKLNETEMQATSLAHGPLSICVDAETWQYYTGGVVTSGCGTDLDHCVQIVGWDSNAKGVKYWIIRNSWNTDWGIKGFIYVERNHDLCGVAMEATYVVSK